MKEWLATWVWNPLCRFWCALVGHLDDVDLVLWDARETPGYKGCSTCGTRRWVP